MEDVRDARPRIAAVVPCFNDGTTLPATLDSLREQEPTELVVVDDGSDDPHTLKLLADLEAAGTAVVRQPNSGPAAARMAGVRATSAPYVFALDADDLVAPGALTDLADALDRDDEAVMAWGDTQMFGDANVHVPKARALDPWQLTYVNPIPTASLIRRDALETVGGWQLESGYEDWDLWLAFAERGWHGLHVERTVARHRVHGARRWSTDFARHTQIEDELRRRHEPLFAQRRENWRRSRAPWRSRLLLPIVFRLPLVPRAIRFRLAVLVGNPVAVPRLWLQGRRRARAAVSDGR
jgi:glycosyltransferase involved in cell wall biosynthesis